MTVWRGVSMFQGPLCLFVASEVKHSLVETLHLFVRKIGRQNIYRANSEMVAVLRFSLGRSVRCHYH